MLFEVRMILGDIISKTKTIYVIADDWKDAGEKAERRYKKDEEYHIYEIRELIAEAIIND